MGGARSANQAAPDGHCDEIVGADTAPKETESIAKGPRETAEEAQLVKVKRLAELLDAGKCKLREGAKGKPDIGHACELAGLSKSAPYVNKKIKDALLALAVGRQMEPRGPRPRAVVKMHTPHMLKRLEKVTSLLTADAVLAQDGELATGRANLARLAGIPGEIWKERPQVVAFMDEVIRNQLSCFKEAPAISTEEILGHLRRWENEFSAFDRVPTVEGTPSAAAAAPLIGIAASTISNCPEAVTELVNIARRRGVYRLEPTKGDGRPAAIQQVIYEYDWLMLKGETFPTVDGAFPDYSRILTGLGINPDLVISPQARTKISILHRALMSAAGYPAIDPGAALAHEYGAVIDRYELYVLIGLQAVPVTEAGEVNLSGVERLYELPAGAMQRFPTLADRVRTIKPIGEDATLSDRQERAKSDALEFILSALAKRNEKSPSPSSRLSSDIFGRVSLSALEFALQIREGSISIFNEAVTAAEAIASRHGLKRFSHGNGYKNPLEPVIDEYVALLRRRGFGGPRDSTLTGKLCMSGVMKELSIIAGREVLVSELSSRHKCIIRRTSDDLKLGAVALDHRAPCPRGSISQAQIDFLERGLASFDGPLPGDPLDDRLVDMAAVAQKCWIEVRPLVENPEYITIINEWALKVGVKPFTHPTITITFGELLARGRELRAVDTTSAKPIEAVSRTAGMLVTLMQTRGWTTTDQVGSLLDATDIDSVAAPETADLARWRRYLAQIRVERMLPADLATSLKILLRLKGRTGRELITVANKAIDKPVPSETFRRWLSGQSEPTFTDQPIINAFEAFFELPIGGLTSKISDGYRNLGTRSRRGLKIPAGFHPHVPPDFYKKDEKTQGSILVWISDNVLTQDLDYSRRLRLLMLDEYRLAYKDWPPELKAEWIAYLNSRRPTDGLETGTKVGSRAHKKPLYAGAGVYLTYLEGFFGFLCRPAVFTEQQRFAHPNKSGPLRDSEMASAAKIHYERQPGLGIDKERLSMGLLAFRDLWRRWAIFYRNRSGGDNETMLQFALFARTMVQKKGFVLKSGAMASKAVEFATWWNSEQDVTVRATIELKPLTEGKDVWKDRCRHAKKVYDEQFKRLLNRRMGRNGEKLMGKRREPFLPVWNVLNSKAPLRYYRVAVRQLVAARPSRIRARHTWVRDCLVTLILFQTLLRIKNIAKLTYRADNTGQLRKVGKKWQIRIHRDNFKNKDGGYFINGEYFEMMLEDEDGLYGIIEDYVNITRVKMLNWGSRP